MTHAASLLIKALSKSYAVGGRMRPVLSDVDLAVAPGEFVSVVGASGCGKSTLLRLIVGLDDQYDGDILVDGIPVNGIGAERGIVFQDHRLFPWLTVAKNVELGLDASDLPGSTKRDLVCEHIRLVRLEGFEQAYPHQLSGGMAQRAAIARALVNQPEILLLDEPFGALDSLTRTYLQDELHRIRTEQGISVVMVTHDVEEAVYLGDKVVVMAPNPGRIETTISIDLPYPRDRGDPRFAALKRRILDRLMH
ncbi:MAG TPA: ABC transporter ATP-binding protein [Stellaceae bacterium]|nr:ABC transporter ATP-binding protein [Stellaceae bacterium]